MGNDAEIDKVKRKNNLCLNLVKVIWNRNIDFIVEYCIMLSFLLFTQPVFQFILDSSLEIKCLKFKMK